MLCQECQEREAKVHITKVINGEKKEIYLCEECAKEKGELDFGIDLSFNKLLTGLLDNNSYDNHQINLSNSQLKCNNCGLTYYQFTRNGQFNCSKCYNNFSNKIDRILRKIHSSNKHTGKIPKRKKEGVRIRRKIERLNEEMKVAINREEFERAAKIRDEIKKLKGEI